MQRPNLTVLTHAEAIACCSTARRPTRVEYVRNGETVRAEAQREVLLSGGSFNSPQLLMLSGIGPAITSERWASSRSPRSRSATTCKIISRVLLL